MKVFDTDFGRIAILTCFDANFDEVWQEAERKGAEIVFWPSAYGGGMPLNGYAMIHNYYIVAVGWGNMIDILGKTIENVEKPRPQQFIATLDLDRTLVHKDFNEEKVARLLAEHKGEVELEKDFDMEAWYLLALGQARRAGARPVQAVPDRDPARVPPPQPRADQRRPPEGEESIKMPEAPWAAACATRSQRGKTSDEVLPDLLLSNWANWSLLGGPGSLSKTSIW